MKKILFILFLNINLYSFDYYISIEKSENSFSIYNEEENIPIAEMRDSSSIPLSIGARSEKINFSENNYGLGFFIELGFSIFDINKQLKNVNNANSETLDYDTSVYGLNSHITPTLFLSIPFPFIVPVGGKHVVASDSIIIGVGVGFAYTLAFGDYTVTNENDPNYYKKTDISANNLGANVIVMLELPLLPITHNGMLSLGVKFSSSSAGEDKEGIYNYNHSYTSYYIKMFF